ncbi:MAG: tail fiber domain-containing protein [Patescibacteria group bacterium]
MQKRTLLLISTFLITALISSASIFAASPSKSLGFQGQLFSNGAPLSSSVNATFTFYDSLSGGSTTGSPIVKTVTVANGYFGTSFTESDTTGVNFDQALYVQVNINGTDLSPRTSLNAAPTALKSFGTFSYSSAPTVGPAGSLYFNTTDNTLYTSNGTTWTSVSLWQANGTTTYYSAGNVAIGTTTAASSTTALTIDLGVNKTQGIHITGTKDKFIFLERANSGGRGLVIGQQSAGQMYGGNASIIRSAGADDNVIEIAPGNDLSSNKGSIQMAPFGGLVGIGNTGPEYKLDITDSVSGSAPDFLRLDNRGTAAVNTGSGILFTARRTGTTRTDIARMSGIITDINTYKGALVFSTANNATPAERMRLDHLGNLGIGTTTPVYKLQIGQISTSTSVFTGAGSNGIGVGNTSSGAVFVGESSAATGPSSGSFIQLYANDGAAMATGDRLAGLIFGGNDGTSMRNAAAITGYAPQTWTSTSAPGELSFETIASGTISRTEKMRLTHDGRLGIGTSTPSANLTASGTIRFTSLVGGGANLVVDSLGNVTVSSDERLKDIQGEFKTGLDKILGINPIVYKWKPETGYDTVNNYAGFSAQNIQENIPEAVGEDARGFLTLADRPILAALVNAVKELAAKVEKIAVWFTDDTTFTVKQDSKLNVEGQVCSDEVCISKDQFKNLLRMAAQNGGGFNVNIQTPSPVQPSQSEPIVSTSTSVEPVIVPEPIVQEPTPTQTVETPSATTPE